MSYTSLHIDKLKEGFIPGQKITIQDIVDFYEQFNERIKRSTIDWRIYKLTQKGILHRLSRGVYALSEGEIQEYVPETDKSLKKLFRKINDQFPFVNTCVWSTKWLNEFMLHQPGRFYTILEVDRDVMESVFYALNDQGKNVFLDPSTEILNQYVANAKEPVIITHLTTEAPIQEVNQVSTTTLEKMLVDIYCDPDLYATFQGAELQRIYQTAFDKYHINEPRMLRYATRRTKKSEIQELINKSKQRQ
ncbi:hypothetical protein JoomaDRAFT_1690 [Galbibacter orientalis DSM 19592]|uniref:Uncharacterized protein n=1 Tax=Galbibacter orientalis DSM 19592 TaxID=926559 RepID=I3C507_9FLAO|nr:DUF6577 family protein [Galbibacter orientalis]EIJ38700.1 hypothetical protein JoomaDRAFT_1690 [Galbibacter orientalis DSM 19592]